MRKVLALAYHYPPVGGAAVQRTARLLTHLPESGYEPVVVAGSGVRGSRWTPRDESLEQDTVGDTEVFRVPGEDQMPKSGRWRGRAERWLGLEKPWSRWWTQGVVDLVGRLPRDIDLIYAPLVPYDGFRAARLVSEALGKPLVVDLHDPWAFDEMMVYPSRFHRKKAERIMRAVLVHADGIVINAMEATARIVKAFPELGGTPLSTIPNGFSADDFAGDSPELDEDAFRIVHTGYLHTELGQGHRRLRLLHGLLGGTLGEVDILTRSHVFLLQAVDQLLAAEPGLRPVEIHLAGVLTSADREVAGTSDVVRLHGYVPHREAVALLRSADLLFLPMQNVAEGRRVGIVPGKTYEYIASRTPILAAVPEGDARDLLLDAGNAAICGPADVAGMRSALKSAIERKRRGEDPPTPAEDVVARLEWRKRSHDLAQLFDAVLDEQPAAGIGEARAGASSGSH
jgi:glycosyltransferase involved in cell wall biosynthesis